jgi:hypothetical protein
LARIAVGAGVTSIGAGDITDERGDATVCGVSGVKHSWSYLNNVVIDVSGMSVGAGVSDRDPVYFDGTDWVTATSGAVGFYDEANAAVITAGYLDGFTGLTPGAIVGNRGVALTATEIVVLETPIDSSGIKTFVGDVDGYLSRSYTLGSTGTHLLMAGFTFVVTGDLGADIPFTHPGTPTFIDDDLYIYHTPAELYMHVRLVAIDQYIGIQTYDASDNVITSYYNSPGTYDIPLIGVARIHYYVSHGVDGGGIDPLYISKADKV